MTWESFDPNKIPLWTPMGAAQAYGAKLMEFGVTNVGSAIDFVEKATKAKSPADFADVLANHTRNQFETLTEQMEELSALVKKTAKDAEEKISSAAKSALNEEENVVGLGD